MMTRLWAKTIAALSLVALGIACGGSSQSPTSTATPTPRSPALTITPTIISLATSTPVAAATATKPPATVTGTTPQSTPSSTVSATPSPTASPVGSQLPLLVPLDPTSASGQLGWVRFTAFGNVTQVELRLVPDPQQPLPVHVHFGSCGAALGGIAFDLGIISPDQIFNKAINTSLSALRSGTFAIDVHQQGTQGASVACGDIPSEAIALTIPMGPLNDSGQTGSATLISRANQTMVLVALEPGRLTSGLVQIHTGQCGPNLGVTAFPLNNFSSGIAGTQLSSTLVNTPLQSLRTGNYAINADAVSNPNLFTACANIPR